VTPAGLDVENYEWAHDGERIAVMAQRDAKDLETSQIVVVDVASGREETVAGRSSWDTSARWLPDGALLHVSDASGWFQVVRRSADGRETVALTAGEREHGEPQAMWGFVPLPSPDGSRYTYPEFHDGLADLLVGETDVAAPKRGRGRPPKTPRPAATAGQPIQPWPGVWRAIGWLADGAYVAALGESEVRAQDLWLLPVPGVAPANARPRPATVSMPAVLAAAFAPGRVAPAERVAIKARDGLRLEGTLWRPPRATGRRGGERVPAIVYPHGGPTAQALRSWIPFKQLLVREGFAFLDIDFRGSTGYGRAFRHANHDEWGHADAFDVVDAARWAAEQPWCDGRLAVYGGSYGGYLTLCALVEEPSLWRAGVDLYGDSEIAESYRHGDRLGRLDLQRMMGSPDDPKRAELYRRGSPVYRAERIEAPLLIIHGRKDKRVVPLMTERMVEALEIEGKHHEVHWYDDEAHGWERRENRRDAYNRILAFLKRHVLDERPEG
jgi:dipeptidyl aminopeptidase/acylaminoacyl peptidase